LLVRLLSLHDSLAIAISPYAEFYIHRGFSTVACLPALRGKITYRARISPGFGAVVHYNAVVFPIAYAGRLAVSGKIRCDGEDSARRRLDILLGLLLAALALLMVRPVCHARA